MNNINTPIKRNSGLQAAEFHKVYKVKAKVHHVCKERAKLKGFVAPIGLNVFAVTL